MFAQLYPECGDHDHWHDCCKSIPVTLAEATYEDWDNGPTWVITCTYNDRIQKDHSYGATKCRLCGTEHAS